MSKTESIGIVRKLDELGRIVIPKEIRTSLGIAERGHLEITAEKDKIILKKYVPDTPSCVFCGNEADVFPFKNKHICKACLREIGL